MKMKKPWLGFFECFPTRRWIGLPGKLGLGGDEFLQLHFGRHGSLSRLPLSRPGSGSTRTHSKTHARRVR